MFAPGSVNFIRRLITDDCAVPWFVYVETFFPAFIKLLIMQNVPFLDDLIRSTGEHLAWGTKAGSGNRRHGTRRVMVPDSPNGPERISQAGLRHVLTLSQPLETIGFAWLLYSTADQFFIDWQSLIDFRGTCVPGASLGMVQRATAGGPVTILTGGTNHALEIQTNLIAPMQTTQGRATGPAGSYQSYFAMSIEAVSVPNQGIEIGLELAIAGVTTTVWSGPQEIRPGSPTGFVVSRDFRVPLGLVFQLRWMVRGPTVPVGAISTQGRAYCQRTNLI